jgi:hypothetical protein
MKRPWLHEGVTTEISGDGAARGTLGRPAATRVALVARLIA